MKVASHSYSPTDWLKTRPYKSLSPYDTFYVQRCRDVYDLLLDYEDWFAENELDRDDLISLTSMLGGYFEDFTSEIGIWSAFVQHNQTIYGYPLPFYDLADYDTDYINEADLAFLIWKFLANTVEDLTCAPDHPYIMELAQAVFELLEEAIDDAPATAFYDTYLRVQATDNFFLLKEKLNWFGSQSYLLGTELGPKMLAAQRENVTKFSPEYAGQMAYMTAEPYAFSVRSSFSALNAAEWFADVARCAPAVKDAIRQTQFVHMGNFDLVSEADKTYYEFRHLQTRRLYRVRRDSLRNGKPLARETRNDMFMMSLRQWQTDWWLSGILAALPATEAQLADFKAKPVSQAWLYDEADLAKVRESERAQEQDFLAFFGGPLAIFANEKDYFAAADALMKYSRDNRPKAMRDVVLLPDEQARLDKKRDQFTGQQSLPAQFRKANDIGLYYRSGMGSMIFSNVKTDAIDLLTAAAPTDKQRRELFEYVVVSMNPWLGRYLLDTYGTRNFKFPVSRSRVDAVRDIEFFWRFYSPDDYGPVFPMITLV